MKNNETKQEWVLSELRKVQEFYIDRISVPGRINLHHMAKDCADVIEDMQKQIQFLTTSLFSAQKELFAMAREPIPEYTRKPNILYGKPVLVGVDAGPVVVDDPMVVLDNLRNQFQEGPIPGTDLEIVKMTQMNVVGEHIPEERIPELDELGGLSKREEALQRFVARGSIKSTQEVEAILGVCPIIVPQRVVDVFSNKTAEEQVALLNKLREDLREDINE